jgi:hypothetical protein
MVARYAGRRYRMATRVRPGQGRVTFVKRLPGGPGSASVTLAYSGDRRFAGESVTLRAAARSPRLRIRPVLSGMASSAGSLRVRGNVVRGARGSVRLRLRYQAADGTVRGSTTRAPIRGGMFASELRLPATARNVTLRAIFAGDPRRHVAGATAAIRLGS